MKLRERRIADLRLGYRYARRLSKEVRELRDVDGVMRGDELTSKMPADVR